MTLCVCVCVYVTRAVSCINNIIILYMYVYRKCVYERRAVLGIRKKTNEILILKVIKCDFIWVETSFVFVSLPPPPATITRLTNNNNITQRLFNIYIYYIRTENERGKSYCGCIAVVRRSKDLETKSVYIMLEVRVYTIVFDD